MEAGYDQVPPAPQGLPLPVVVNVHAGQTPTLSALVDQFDVKDGSLGGLWAIHVWGGEG